MALIDDVIIKVKAGDGGSGGRAFHSYYGSTKKHPDGGDGGNGGSVLFQGSSNLSDLSEFRFRKHIAAPDGVRGMNKSLDGKSGEDKIVLVPLGTTIIDTKTQKTVEILTEDNPVLIAKGGLGIPGNHSLHEMGYPMKKMDDRQRGQEKELHLILNLIADIGLIGLPNAGKSSLLKALTAALPKIGNYPFTTLEPNLGTMAKNETENSSGKNIVLADIPGLVEGASRGRGLGIQFLKHIQKTKILLHCIDASQPSVYETYKTVRGEFEEYDKRLLEKQEIILLTKVDLTDPAFLKKQTAELKKTKRKIIHVSIYQPESLTALKNALLLAQSELI